MVYMSMFVGPVNRILSLKVWEPLVRLCFIMYLAHPIVMGLFLFNLKQTIYITELIGVGARSETEAEAIDKAETEADIKPEPCSETEAET